MHILRPLDCHYFWQPWGWVGLYCLHCPPAHMRGVYGKILAVAWKPTLLLLSLLKMTECLLLTTTVQQIIYFVSKLDDSCYVMFLALILSKMELAKSSVMYCTYTLYSTAVWWCHCFTVHSCFSLVSSNQENFICQSNYVQLTALKSLGSLKSDNFSIFQFRKLMSWKLFQNPKFFNLISPCLSPKSPDTPSPTPSWCSLWNKPHFSSCGKRPYVTIVFYLPHLSVITWSEKICLGGVVQSLLFLGIVLC